MSSRSGVLIGDDGFRLRGTALARIDAFSDVVFGFALTLLVVSLEVPKTFAELHNSLRGFVPFAICFLFLMMIWYAHYLFFRRFGLHDFRTIVINAILLFLILFYVYPLKFLFTFTTGWLSGIPTHSLKSYDELVELMLLYGLGFAAIYFTIGALYWNGWRQRALLEFNVVERTLAVGYIWQAIGVGSIGLLACLAALAVPQHYAGLTGWTYSLIAVFRPLWRRRMDRKVAAVKNREQAADRAAEGAAEEAAPATLINSVIDASRDATR